MLDMRMDSNRNDLQTITAFDVLHTLDSESLARIFSYYGGERKARKFADLIVDARHMMKRIGTPEELAFLLGSISGGSISNARDAEREETRNADDDCFESGLSNTGPTGRVFYALRSFVNNELNELNYCLDKVRPYLKLDTSLAERVHAGDLARSSWDSYDVNNDSKAQQMDKERKSLTTALTAVEKAGCLVVITYTQQEDSIVKSHLSALPLMNLDSSEHMQPLVARSRSSLCATVAADARKIRNPFWLPLNKHVWTLTVDEQRQLPPPYRTAKMRTAVRLSWISFRMFWIKTILQTLRLWRHIHDKTNGLW